MRRRKAKSNALAADSISPELATMIKRDIGAGSMALEPIVRTVAAKEAGRHRALASPTGAFIEAVRQGDHGAALEHLAGQLLQGWIEPAWGGDPVTLPPWEVLTPRPWRLVGRRLDVIRRLAAKAKISAGALQREILKSAVIATIHDGDRPAGQSLLWAIFDGNVPAGADQIVGRVKPGEVDEWDVYVQWFHRRALALANAFLDEEGETELISSPVETPPPDATTRDVPPEVSSSTEPRLSGAFKPDVTDLALDAIQTEGVLVRSGSVPNGAACPGTFGRQVMRSLVAILVGEGPGTMKPVAVSEAPRVVAVVREAIEAELVGIAPKEPPSTTSWAEKLWTCPAETRLGVRQLAEAVGRPPSWVYRHASPKGDLAPIPHRRLDGLLVFTAGEVRTWLQANEEIL
jgi:hypothetical protein